MSLSLQLGLRLGLLSGGFSPASLFAAGESGYWLDPSDFSTMFQDSAGSTPVTATGQTVGLILDKSQGLVLGPELVTNDGPFANSTGWTCGRGGATISVSDSKLRLTSTTGAAADIQFTLTGLTVGMTYRLSYSGVLGTAPNFRLRASSVVGLAGGNQVDIVFVGNANGDVLFVANASTMYVGLLAQFTGIGQFIELVSAGTKELPGNHFLQATAGNRPILGVEPAGGRRNLLTYTEQFDNVVWAKNNGATATARAITFTADTNSRIVLNLIAPATTPASFTATVYFSTADVGKTVTLGIWTSTLNGVSSGRSANLTIPANGVVTHTWSSGLAGLSNFGILTDTAGGAKTVTLAGGLGAQLEVGSTATDYQRVTDQWNVTEAGVTPCYYLAFDGTDDWLQSAATINPGAVDKAQVFAGVRKLSDAAIGMVVESSTAASASNPGSLNIVGPNSAAAADYGFRSGGTVSVGINSGGTAYAAPITNVLTMTAAIGTDSLVGRINGAQVNSSTADQGTGNYLTYTHYIGRRGGTTLPYNGRIYQMVMRYGPNLSAGIITQTETYVNSKTGAY